MASSSSKNQQNEEPMNVDYEEQEYQEKSADANVASSQATKGKKGVEPWSKVWENYTRTKESREKCICHHCVKTFSCASKSGTSNLKKHLQICKEHQSWLISKKKNQHQLGSEGKMKTSRVSETVFKEAYNELMVLGELPLLRLNTSVIRLTCSSLSQVRQGTLWRCKKKVALKNLLCSSKQRVSLISDIWVSQIRGCACRGHYSGSSLGLIPRSMKLRHNKKLPTAKFPSGLMSPTALWCVTQAVV